MPAASYNFQIEQGSDFTINFQYSDSEGNPIDLSNKCIVLRWAESSGANPLTFSSSTTASLTNNSGYSLTGNNLGLINFQISAEKTQLYNFTTVIYDLDIVENTNQSIKNTRILTGTIGLIKRNFVLVDNCALINSDPSVPLPGDAPTVTITPTPDNLTPTPTATSTDLCLPEDCSILDIYSTVYASSGLNILDNQNNSGILSINTTGVIENVELAVNGLIHNSPQDLIFILTPPSGSGILLSSNSKISNYSNNNKFSFMFSNKAASGSYLHNITNGGLCNIYNKTNITKFNNQNLLYSFDHLFNSSITGVWTLNVNDTDVGTSGTIDSWKLILTYQAPSGTEE